MAKDYVHRKSLFFVSENLEQILIGMDKILWSFKLNDNEYLILTNIITDIYPNTLEVYTNTLSLASTSAPDSTSFSMISKFPLAAAQCNGVLSNWNDNQYPKMY